ncbi:MAG: peptide ABC transporter substrate-binding protein [Patescibacteria group bacterium]
MIKRLTRLRWRRRIRKGRRQVEDISVQAEEQMERHFFKRLTRLFNVRRFVIGWITLIVLLGLAVTMQLRSLGGYYQELQPVPGGSFTEGMIGTFTNANPLYSTGLVDSTVSRLVFSGLLKYDEQNKLVGDLAENWQADENSKIYTVTLRPHLKWHDDKPLTADDVVFTFHAIQNPDTKSPFFRAWQGVDIKAVDAKTIVFTLPSPLAPFIYSLTTGIVPKHLLSDIEPSQLRSLQFNTSRPIGSGPFKWDTVETTSNGPDSKLQQIGLQSFENYHHGKPKLERFIVRAYTSEKDLVDSFQRQEISGLVGLDRPPDSIKDVENIQENTASLTAETMVFLRTDSELLKDVRVRQALLKAIDVPALVSGLDYPAIAADEPLLHGQLGYNATLKQVPFSIEEANKLLDESGWKRLDDKSVRMNGDKKLILKFVAQNNADYVYLTKQIQKAWLSVGVETQVILQNDADLQDTINERDYDALLYGISIGVDPDVFAYWHSTQADPRASSRLNFSNYKSATADKALEAGRTRIDPSLRAAKYIPFLQSWRGDVPAIALYQPRFLYITSDRLFNFQPRAINTAADRFNNVHNWMILQDYTLKTR